MKTFQGRAPWVVAVLLSACNGGDAGSGHGPAGDVASGRALFAQHCAICHGVRGDGRGMRSGSLSSPPRDFTNPAWRDSRGPDAVFEVITRGVAATAMPAWGPVLGSSERRDLAAYVLSLAPR